MAAGVTFDTREGELSRQEARKQKVASGAEVDIVQMELVHQPKHRR